MVGISISRSRFPPKYLVWPFPFEFISIKQIRIEIGRSLYRVVIKTIDGVRKRQLNLSNQLLTLPFLLQTLIFYFEYETEVFSLQYFFFNQKRKRVQLFHSLCFNPLNSPFRTAGTYVDYRLFYFCTCLTA